ncbi:MAG TPA: LytTR family DNA-binding domain-containing protein [Fibrobacteraceae bacterium]|nr:LytTR family DNA-binding domain-containing protein [Fibrobacteraceae bacterium]
MRVLIIDDEEAARHLMRIYLADHPDCEIVGEAADGFEGYRCIRELQPDLVFLDIQMPRISGFEMLELLETPPIIIFATAYDQFAVKAFEMNAADYLLKPFSKDRVVAAIDKVRQRLQQTNPNLSVEKAVLETVQAQNDILERIAVKVRQKVLIIPVDKIYRIEAEGDYVTLHTPEGRYLKEFTMKYLENHLPPGKFVRVHRSNFVCIEAVKGLEHSSAEIWHVRLKDDQLVRASAEGIKQLKRALGM